MNNNEIITRFKLSRQYGSILLENVTAKESPDGFVIEIKGPNVRENVNAVLSYVYDGHTYFNQGYSVVNMANRYGVIDFSLKEVVGLEYARIEYINENYAVGRRGNSYYYLDLCADIRCTEIYEAFDDAKAIVNGMGMVCRDGKWGFFSPQGLTMVVPCEYDDAKSFSLTRDYTAVKKDGLWGLVNKQGEIILEPVFNSIIFTHDGSYEAEIGDVKYVGGPNGYKEKCNS